MVWWGGVPSGGDTSSFLRERCENWCPSVSRGCATRSCETSKHNGLQWPEMCLQAGLGSCPQGQTTQEWLRGTFRPFISSEDWPSGSPDLNSLDYKPWAVLEDMACRKRHNNLDSLKRSLVKAAAEIRLETGRAVIAEWPECLKTCVGAEGGHFELTLL